MPLQEQIDSYTSEGSGWSFGVTKTLYVEAADYKPLRGKTYIKTPDCIPKRTVINIENKDNRCFCYAILSALHPKDKHPERVNQYNQYENELI